MIGVGLILAILATHYVADFVFQTSWMAVQKSTNLIALSVHVLEYTGVLAAFSLGYLLLVGGNPLLLFAWCGLNGGAHWVVDFCSSRLNKRWQAAGQLRRFWITLGADQLLHQAGLLGLWAWLCL